MDLAREIAAAAREVDLVRGALAELRADHNSPLTKSGPADSLRS
jgi:hypothetical protein